MNSPELSANSKSETEVIPDNDRARGNQVPTFGHNCNVEIETIDTKSPSQKETTTKHDEGKLLIGESRHQSDSTQIVPDGPQSDTIDIVPDNTANSIASSDLLDSAQQTTLPQTALQSDAESKKIDSDGSIVEKEIATTEEKAPENATQESIQTLQSAIVERECGKPLVSPTNATVPLLNATAL